MIPATTIKTKFIFITGGVVSSLGKGLASASLAALLQARGYSVKLRKLDPYLNVDPGTMSPTQHGEVFVTEDGAETDLDLGHYERFTGVDAKKSDNVTAGQIYFKLLAKERKGDYLGGTVQVIPHVTNLIKEFILNGVSNADFANTDFLLCEIGGTVGDIEALPFFEAIRQLGYEMPNSCAFLHLTLLPYIESANELKTKPTQHSVKELRSIGIQPSILLCRAERTVTQAHLEKIAQMCSVPRSCVIAAPNVKSIYEAPLVYHQNGLDTEILKFFKLDYKKKPDLTKWLKIKDAIENPQKEVNIAIVGKYTDYRDSYKSLLEAIDHAAFSLKSKANVIWVNARSSKIDLPKNIHAILVPGGFGESGTEGKIAMIKHARINKIPYLGICFGMQMAVIEYARNVLDIKNATSSEIAKTGQFLIGMMHEWQDGKKTKKAGADLGGTMRLGAYPCKITKGSFVEKIYGKTAISERHRHRYEVNINFKEKLEKAGLIFSGMSPDSKLPEIIEIKNHPFFIGVQFHPELKSKPFAPHPLFVSFVKAATRNV
ncbi:MAG: CTP synthase [Alphaproteobacteria bacterium RIFCSPLOWO2_01_FULL_40_26]|nr:MAG: CTP synthase [Alphaproteobacteria bacterium RIFCSPHIGHO2_02_FULL_40_34]OFW88836.1 MAG: CTP synthase [Alphaproteobacteria bacterium RIFCSPHIGHO2_01_FULL_40_8]OFW93962.1 MAG: CTP synthase [Alphaproteobacteria bacterium RIFCSPLOWO2_01_FULL_40_26]OFX09674.1 MAG: CTP synthase [Alphaproteobacteria bacterium RIFCSPLOWO2_02_FULL_40_19]OFX12003.1 MAG: CTP synthase [Alphaproteobacteria bacterium RIFCSPLOWO2_12_FULL_40_11]